MEKLDNPVWHALGETHASYCLNLGNGRFYKPDYCPFGAFSDFTSQTPRSLNGYARLSDTFFVVGEQPEHDQSVVCTAVVACDQMVLEKPAGVELTLDIVALNHRYEEELFMLVDLVQPGYFRPSTPSLGAYSGIFEDGKLVAAAGERMKMNGMTEISAVVTHPGYTGRGFARQLVASTANRIFEEGNIPFLHVAETNAGAIALYEKLGFRYRRKMMFRKFAYQAG